ncbi:MAG: hypothetical protein ABWY52_05730 [Candidatus Limnocylindrales bacterium]
MTLGWRSNEAEEALQIDVYLESLLRTHDRAPATLIDRHLIDELDPAERRTARLLADNLLRFHPSYRFEEALAARLHAAAGEPEPEEGRSLATIVAFPDAVRDRVRRTEQDHRRVLIGGAIASGVSLAGAALFAWRASTPARTPFGRATRAAHRGRSSVRGRA